MRASAVLLALGALGAGLGACGLPVVGSAADEGPSDDPAPRTDGTDGSSPNAPGVDASAVDGSSDPPSPPGCDPDACVLPSSPGFALALFGDPAQPCPADFAASDVVESPIAGAGACTCGDCTAQVDCTTGTIPTNYDNGNGTCNQNGAAHLANKGVCRNVNGVFGAYASVEPPAAVVSACTAPGVASPAAVTTTPRRICTPAASACTALACAPPAGLSACLVQDGDVACPASAPNKHLVGGDVALTCGACSCTVTATCGGKMEFFSQQGCNGSVTSLTTDVCTKTSNASFSSTKWTGTVAQRQCTKDAPPAPTVALTGPRTVCCL